MPVHDWTRVSAGTIHDFHCTWIPDLKTRLNAGLLPPDYYAQVEQQAEGVNADILALGTDPLPAEPTGGAVVTVPPRGRFTASLERATYARRARRLVIRHSRDDRVVAWVEVVSPGNKAGRQPFPTFLTKAAALAHGHHLSWIDLLPPGPRDPQGIHGALWADLGDDTYRHPPR